MVGGYAKFSLGLKKAVHRICQRFESENEGSFFKMIASAEPAAKSNLLDKFVAVGPTSGDDDLL